MPVVGRCCDAYVFLACDRDASLAPLLHRRPVDATCSAPAGRLAPKFLSSLTMMVPRAKQKTPTFTTHKT
jgi:hypothetical protein